MKFAGWGGELVLVKERHLFGFFVGGAVFFWEFAVGGVRLGVGILGQMEAYVGWVEGFPGTFRRRFVVGVVLVGRDEVRKTSE